MGMQQRRTSTAILAFALVPIGACSGKRDPQDPPEVEIREAEPPGSDETGGPEPGREPVAEPEPDDPRAAALSIARATSPATITASGSKSLGFNLDKISHLFALAATAKVPAWGASTDGAGDAGAAKLARDDDLDSAWRCEFGGAKPCVLGLALPEPAKVEALRVHVAAGPGFREYLAHPRIAKVRVHTAAGYLDAELADGANHAYVRFDAPIETQQLALEVLDVYPGKADARVQVAEIEIYGTDGVPRQPIELDPSYAWLSWETTTWAASAAGHTIRQVFVNFAQPGLDGEPPSSKRWFRASAVFGRGDDDYLLFERLHGTDCVATRGSYVLFDKRNRMFYPLGDLGGAAAEVYRHANGRGFAVGWIADGLFTIKGVVEEAGELTWKRPPAQAPADLVSARALLQEWGFEQTPLARAQPQAAGLSGAIAGCRSANTVELELLARVAKLERGAIADPSAWLACSVGPDTLFATAACGQRQPARAYQMAAGALVGSLVSDGPDTRGLRLRRVGDRLLVELSRLDGDSSSLVWAEPGQLVELGGGARAGAGLFVRPPAGCMTCSDVWPRPSPSAPAEARAGETGEAGAAEDEQVDGLVSLADE
jgi:hypothetical protein